MNNFQSPPFVSEVISPSNLRNSSLPSVWPPLSRASIFGTLFSIWSWRGMPISFGKRKPERRWDYCMSWRREYKGVAPGGAPGLPWEPFEGSGRLTGEQAGRRTTFLVWQCWLFPRFWLRGQRPGGLTSITASPELTKPMHMSVSFQSCWSTMPRTPCSSSIPNPSLDNLNLHLDYSLRSGFPAIIAKKIFFTISFFVLTK